MSFLGESGGMFPQKISKFRCLEMLFSTLSRQYLGVYLGVKTCEVFICFVAIVRVRVYYVDLLFSLFYVTDECHRFLH